MAQEATHILKIFKSQDSEMLFRADDGICIGQRKNETVIFGEEPNKRSSHVFINGAKAVAWLEAYAAEDLKKRGVSRGCAGRAARTRRASSSSRRAASTCPSTERIR